MGESNELAATPAAMVTESTVASAPDIDDNDDVDDSDSVVLVEDESQIKSIQESVDKTKKQLLVI